MSFVNIAGIAISSLFIFFILSKKKRKRADYLLVVTNLLMCTFLAVNMISKERLTDVSFFHTNDSALFSASLFSAVRYGFDAVEITGARVDGVFAFHCCFGLHCR